MTYTFRYAGELREGAIEENVVKNLSRLFKTPPEKIEQLFNQQYEFVVNDLSKEVASDYRNAFSRAGAVGYITSIDTTEKESSQSTFNSVEDITNKNHSATEPPKEDIKPDHGSSLDRTSDNRTTNNRTTNNKTKQDIFVHTLDKGQSQTAKWLRIGALCVLVTMIIDSQLQSMLVVDRFGLDIGVFPIILAHLPLAYGCYLLAKEKKLATPYFALCLLSFAGLAILMMLPKKGDRNHKVPLSALLIAVFSCGVLIYWFGGTAKTSAETQGYYDRLKLVSEDRAQYPSERLQSDNSLFINERHELLSLVYDIIDFIDADELRPDEASKLASMMMSEIARYASWRNYQTYLFLSQRETPPDDLTQAAQDNDQREFSKVINSVGRASHPRLYEEVSFWIAGSPNSDVFYRKYGKQIELNDMHNAVFDLWIRSQDPRTKNRNPVQQDESTSTDALAPTLDLNLLAAPPLRNAIVNRYESHIEYAFSSGEFAGKVLAIGFYTKKNKPRWDKKVSYSPVYKVINSDIPAVKISGLLNILKDYSKL